MNLSDVLARAAVPKPWAEGEKIPWHEPEFSQRMLREHLSQAHDAASRRFAVIDRHVAWIHNALLHARPGRVLDLACGPGLYTSRLAALGHECTGIDFGPASIAYARQEAEAKLLHCTYVEQDVRTAEYGEGYDLVMLLFGELNVFRATEAQAILGAAYNALRPGGMLLLEPHTYDAVRRVGEQPSTWYAAAEGLFSEAPHLCLMESFWDDGQAVATERYYIVDTGTGRVTRHASSMQAYTDEQYRALLRTCGFEPVMLFASMEGTPAETAGDLLALVGVRPADPPARRR